jgi:hypothetical protein
MNILVEGLDGSESEQLVRFHRMVFVFVPLFLVSSQFRGSRSY